MANMTLSIPDEVHEKMKAYPHIRWSEVARRAITEKVETMERWDEVERICQKSKLTMKDVEEIGRKIKHGAAEAFRRDADKWLSTRTSSSQPSSKTE